MQVCLAALVGQPASGMSAEKGLEFRLEAFPVQKKAPPGPEDSGALR